MRIVGLDDILIRVDVIFEIEDLNCLKTVVCCSIVAEMSLVYY